MSLYIWTRACPPLFACLFRLDVIRRKETNSDLISITFCDDAAHFFNPLLPSSCVRGWYLFERKKVAKSSISLLNVSERTNERGSRHFAADSTGWLVVCVCEREREEKTETSYSAGIYLYVPWRLAPLLSTVLYSPFVLFLKRKRTIFPICWIVYFLLFLLDPRTRLFFFSFFSGS